MSKPRPQAFDLPPPPPGLTDPAVQPAGADWRAPAPMAQQPSAAVGNPMPSPLNGPPVMHPKAMDPLAKLGFFKALYHFMTDKSATVLGRLFVLFVAVYVVCPI